MKLHLPESEESLTNPENFRVTTCPQSIFLKKTRHHVISRKIFT